MPRIFGCVAIAHVILLVATAVLAFMGEHAQAQRHVVLSVFTLILGCLLQILVFTYFTVTGKMMRQAIHLGRLETAPLIELDRHKRHVTILLAVFMASVLFLTATGATHWREGQSATLHQAAAGIALLVQLFCWAADFHAIAQHSVVFDRTMREYAARKETAAKV